MPGNRRLSRLRQSVPPQPRHFSVMTSAPDPGAWPGRRRGGAAAIHQTTRCNRRLRRSIPCSRGITYRRKRVSSEGPARARTLLTVRVEEDAQKPLKGEPRVGSFWYLPRLFLEDLASSISVCFLCPRARLLQVALRYVMRELRLLQYLLGQRPAPELVASSFQMWLALRPTPSR
jgi:hypothetical protein